MFKVIDSTNAHKWQAPCFESANEDRIGKSEEQKKNQAELIEEITQRAYKQAFEKGYQEGLQQARELAEKKAQHLASIMSLLAKPLSQMDEQVVNDLSELAMTVARHLVRRELKTSPDEIIVVVKEALAMLPIASSNVVLKLHPEDAALVNEALANADKESGWRIIEDPLLSRGGCRVITDNSRIDASVESRLNAAIASAMGGERESDEAV